MRILLLAAFLFGICLPSSHAHAEDVFDRLQNEPVTMLDFGIKRLRTMAQQATKRIALSSEPLAQTNVEFDKAKREIRILFVVRTTPEFLNKASCQTRRKVAINEVFLVGATNYVVPVSEEQRVMFRLGRMFTREPAEQQDSVKAMGERMAESTYVQMNLYDMSGNNPVICAGRATDLKGQ